MHCVFVTAPPLTVTEQARHACDRAWSKRDIWCAVGAYRFWWAARPGSQNNTDYTEKQTRKESNLWCFAQGQQKTLREAPQLTHFSV
jgi:hypothetical protein